ncbi:HNH endonuclease [Leisingera sp.]|uniref:HNH endonuclease n=1 Tax=Leisingera sp. TaxID=1879318 RepID=UPI002B2658E2|nr:HNH endonuclease [Leisingera sp.]
MSRKKFVQALGATCDNWNWSWSFVNHEERFVIIGAWQHFDKDGVQRVFSESWSIPQPGKKRAAGYAQTLRHLELVLEENYRLLTFRQIAVPGTEKDTPKILRCEEPSEERKLIQEGSEYYALVREVTAPDAAKNLANTQFLEGARLDVLQTKYERNAQARAACLAKYGYVCSVCNFDFQATFGEIGREFIHVHHLVPVSARKKTYEINPVTDLRPVCPNCHAMLHKRQPPFQIEELKKLIRENA